VAKKVGGIEHQTVPNWLQKILKLEKFAEPPDSRQHFDIWEFAKADKDAGQQSYFGTIAAMSPKASQRAALQGPRRNHLARRLLSKPWPLTLRILPTA
jgi:hypothetical protein